MIPKIRDQLSEVELKELSKCVVKEEWGRGSKGRTYICSYSHCQFYYKQQGQPNSIAREGTVQ